MADAATEFMRSYEVPGLGVAIARHGVLVYDEAFGVADREAGETHARASLPDRERVEADHLRRDVHVDRAGSAAPR
jgi:Beta-lactamase